MIITGRHKTADKIFHRHCHVIQDFAEGHIKNMGQFFSSCFFTQIINGTHSLAEGFSE